MITRRTLLKVGAAAALAPTITTAQAKRSTMPRAFVYAPHPDDETLSMGLLMMHFIASGFEVHLVSMNSGGALGVANTLNGVTSCTLADHGYTHSPVREGYAQLSVEDIGAVRIREARSALGAMAMLPSTTPGTVFHHVADLPDGFGAGSTTSSTAPVIPEGVAAAKAVIKSYVDAYPNSFHYTMSESDAHPDHAACGLALRELKNDTTNKVPWADITYRDALANAKFLVSRLYWKASQPNNEYPSAVLAAGAVEAVAPATSTLAWFSAGSRKAEYDAWLRGKVIVPYKAWNPAAGAYGIGYHQVAGQFNNNFNPGVSIGNLMHS